MRNRAVQRGKPLDDDCKQIAKTTGHEYGLDDDRIYCYGLYYGDDDWPWMLEKCQNCGAYVGNAKPLRGGEQDGI